MNIPVGAGLIDFRYHYATWVVLLLAYFLPFDAALAAMTAIMTNQLTAVAFELLAVCLGEALLAIVPAVLFHLLRTQALSVTRQTVVLALGAGIGSIIVFIPMVFLIDHIVLSLATR